MRLERSTSALLPPVRACTEGKKLACVSCEFEMCCYLQGRAPLAVRIAKEGETKDGDLLSSSRSVCGEGELIPRMSWSGADCVVLERSAVLWHKLSCFGTNWVVSWGKIQPCYGALDTSGRPPQTEAEPLPILGGGSSSHIPLTQMRYSGVPCLWCGVCHLAYSTARCTSPCSTGAHIPLACGAPRISCLTCGHSTSPAVSHTPAHVTVRLLAWCEHTGRFSMHLRAQHVAPPCPCHMPHNAAHSSVMLLRVRTIYSWGSSALKSVCSAKAAGIVRVESPSEGRG